MVVDPRIGRSVLKAEAEGRAAWQGYRFIVEAKDRWWLSGEWLVTRVGSAKSGGDVEGERDGNQGPNTVFGRGGCGIRWGFAVASVVAAFATQRERLERLEPGIAPADGRS